MRLIDADKLSARLSRNATPYFTVPDIENAPTIDAVPVVRCKDCRYFKMYKCRMGYSNYNDFCSYGEKNSEVST